MSAATQPSGAAPKPSWYYPFLSLLVTAAAIGSLVIFMKDTNGASARVLVVCWSTVPPAYFFLEYWVARRRGWRDIENMMKAQELARHIWLGVVGAMIALASMRASQGQVSGVTAYPTKQLHEISWGSIPDWINVLVILVVASITFWYAKTTARTCEKCDDASSGGSQNRRAHVVTMACAGIE